MIGVIEDCEVDCLFTKKYILKDIKHKAFKDLQSIIEDKNIFSLILTDLSLPDSYGVDTVISLREKYKCPIFVLTGLGGSLLTGKMSFILMDNGADHVFQKEMLKDKKYSSFIRQEIKKVLKVV